MTDRYQATYIIVGGAVTLAGLAYFSLRQTLLKNRIRRFTGGKVPTAMNLGVVYYGLSTEAGRFRKREGAIFGTREALVFLKAWPGAEIVEMPWDRLVRWEAVGKFRERPLDRKIISVVMESEVGSPIALGFAVPRPEFWTSLIDVAIASDKK